MLAAGRELQSCLAYQQTATEQAVAASLSCLLLAELSATPPLPSAGELGTQGLHLAHDLRSGVLCSGDGEQHARGPGSQAVLSGCCMPCSGSMSTAWTALLLCHLPALGHFSLVLRCLQMHTGAARYDFDRFGIVSAWGDHARWCPSLPAAVWPALL